MLTADENSTQFFPSHCGKLARIFDEEEDEEDSMMIGGLPGRWVSCESSSSVGAGVGTGVMSTKFVGRCGCGW